MSFLCSFLLLYLSFSWKVLLGCPLLDIVVRGHHVLFREYAFVTRTARNRKAFLQGLWASYKNMTRPANGVSMLSLADIHSLVCLLCKVRMQPESGE